MDLHYKQEVTVGALVVVGVALFVAGTMWLGGGGFSRAPSVPIAFPDAGTLKKGSPVRVSGVTLGSVESIDFQDFGKVLVEITLDPRVKPKSDASARLASVGLVADAIINFNPGTAPDPLPAGKVVTGPVETGFMALGSELGERAKTVMSGISEVANAKLADDLHRTMTAMQRMADLYSNPEDGPSAEPPGPLSGVERTSRRPRWVPADASPAPTARRAASLRGDLPRLSAD